MENLLKLLNDYSKEKHLKNLYSEFPKIDFQIMPLYSANWSNTTWLTLNEAPYIALSHLLDSYYCLPERPDMAFTHIWKSINSTYITIGKKDIISKKTNIQLSDSLGIDYLVNGINAHRNDLIDTTTTIKSLLNEYIQIVPDKSLRFVSNTMLKGLVIENAKFPSIFNSSSYFSIKKNHSVLLEAVKNTYGISYTAITKPEAEVIRVNLKITNEEKSRSIPHSLSLKLRELILTGNTTLANSTKSANYPVNYDDKKIIDFVIRVLLYSIRNNSVHGNLASRLNSEFVNKDSLKNSIYIYFLAHFILSLGMYLDKEIELSELQLNIENLKLLKSIIK